MKKLSLLAVSMLLLLSGSIVSGQGNSTGYTIVNKFSLPGDGFWDYLTVDEAGSRLFLSHGTVVQVVNLKDGQLIGTIDDTPGVHGIALAPDLNKAFISCGRDASVKVINFNTLAVIADVQVTGENPDAIIYDKYSGKVLTFNGRTANSTIIDAKTDKIVGTIALEGKPEFPASNGKGKIYVNIEDKSLISVIDINAMKVITSWPIAPGVEASGLALDRETNRLFAVCRNKLMVVVNAESGKVITSLPIGEGCDGVKFDPELKRAYASCGDGTMTVVQEVDKDHFKVLTTIKTAAGARTLAVDTKTHHIYTPTAEFNPAPAPTADNPRPRRSMKPGSFYVIDIAPSK